MSESSTPKKPLLSDGSYNVLKQSVTIVLPAVGALYFALAQIWNLPKAEEVVGSVAAVNTFLGVVLGLSTRSYNKSDQKYAGELEVIESPEGQLYNFNLGQAPEELVERKDFLFRVNRDNR